MDEGVCRCCLFFFASIVACASLGSDVVLSEALGYALQTDPERRMRRGLLGSAGEKYVRLCFWVLSASSDST